MTFFEVIGIGTIVILVFAISMRIYGIYEELINKYKRWIIK